MHTHNDGSQQIRNALSTDLSDTTKDGAESGLAHEAPDAERARSQYEMVNRSAQVAQLQKFQSQADQFVSGKNSPHPVQRKVEVNGVRKTEQEITDHFDGSADALNARQREIIQLWVAANRTHNFRGSQGRTAWEKVPRALASAEQMSAAPKPALFSAANFQFITKEGGRFATYYFSGGGQTGRLRQQHISGPLAQVDPAPQQRISFANRDDRDDFITDLRTSRNNHAPFVLPNPVTWNAPAAGEHLLEYHLAGNQADGFHPSGGLIENKNVTDGAITKIYNKIVGHPNPGGGCFITTACMMAKGLADDCDELETLRDYRDQYLLYRKHGMELFKFYYTYSPAIVEGINANPSSVEIYSNLYGVIRQCVSCIRRRDLEEAFLIYVNMVLMLQTRYAPGMTVPGRLRKILMESIQLTKQV